LVDLSTHTKGARPGILALKPARAQITHVATAGTLAMSAIDFKLTDRYADVPHDPELQIEPLLVMDGCVYPYRHIPPAADALSTRQRLGVDASATLIGAFCTPLKLSQRCLALWRDVLKELRVRCSRSRRCALRCNRCSRTSAPLSASTRAGSCSCRRDGTMPRTRRATG
jgi:predicted O-linked N-acetylglucosamine transferase (SPINDLY family)